MTRTIGHSEPCFRRSMNFVQSDAATGFPPKPNRWSLEPTERRVTSRCSTDPLSPLYILRSKMLVAKSIRTGCLSTSGNPVWLYSHAALEHDGRTPKSRNEDKHRGQRTQSFQHSGSAREYL